MLLIYPPVTKACEPPAGLSILGAALKSHNIDYKIIDMNYEATIYILNKYFKDKPKKKHYLNLIRSKEGYINLDKYKKIISELTAGLNYNNSNSNITLANFTSSKYDSLKSKDLLKAAQEYNQSPFYNYFKERIDDLLLKKSINTIGLSIQFLNQAVVAFSIIGYIKQNYPKIKIIIGGGLITSWVKSYNWSNPFSTLVDKVVSGPGEVELLKFIGKKPDSDKLKHLIPDYDFIKNYKYLSPVQILPVSASLGCSWRRCTFCPENAENNPFIAKKITSVINEITQIKKMYNPGLIHFMDNEITPALLKALINSQEKIPWYGFTKFYKELLNSDFCIKLKKSGCEMLKLGLESGNQSVLDSMNKGIILDDATQILKNLYNAGIKTFVYLLFGTPDEDYIKAKDTLDYTRANAKYITYLNIAIFNLPLNSDIAKNNKIYNLSDSDLSLYCGFEHLKGWNRKDVRQFLDKEFKNKPEIKRILNRSIPVFNANHAPFITLPDNY